MWMGLYVETLRKMTEDEVILLSVRPRIKLGFPQHIVPFIASPKYLLYEKIICSYFQTAYSSIQKSG